MTPSLVITCEHGGNEIPPPYRPIFRHRRALLDSHRGFDIGALIMARALAKAFHAPLASATVSRLVVDLNRSIGHRDLHMDTINELPGDVRQHIIDEFYLPYRTTVTRLVSSGIARRRKVVHVSCHSFTPSLNGVDRDADIGLLYDPQRRQEREFCINWKAQLSSSLPAFTIRRNFPYRGYNDGLTTTLRGRFSAETYLGIELELNQKNLATPSSEWSTLRDSIITTLGSALTGSTHSLQHSKSRHREQHSL